MKKIIFILLLTPFSANSEVYNCDKLKGYIDGLGDKSLKEQICNSTKEDNGVW